MRTALLAAVAALGLSGVAQADEQWTSGDQTIIYELEEGSLAVFSIGDTTLYIDGLAGVYENRGTYPGIWMLDDVPLVRDENGNEIPADGCGFSMLRPGKSGETSDYWGQVEITFIDEDFPSVWIGYFGDCFDPPSETLIARPVVAE